MEKYPFLKKISGIYIQSVEGDKYARKKIKEGHIFLPVTEDMLEEVEDYLKPEERFVIKELLDKEVLNLTWGFGSAEIWKKET